MIFASVGSMLPFDRLVRAVDEWAAANPDQAVFIQIGEGAFVPQHAEWARIIPSGDYRQKLTDCDLFVAHVGMGSILQALEARTQMLLMPRQATLREHTTEHQLHTAARFRDRPGLEIVDDAAALKAAMSRLLVEPMRPSDGISSFAPSEMIEKVAAHLAQQARL